LPVNLVNKQKEKVTNWKKKKIYLFDEYTTLYMEGIHKTLLELVSELSRLQDIRSKYENKCYVYILAMIIRNQ
jgi:hypothetical protein